MTITGHCAYCGSLQPVNDNKIGNHADVNPPDDQRGRPCPGRGIPPVSTYGPGIEPAWGLLGLMGGRADVRHHLLRGPRCSTCDHANILTFVPEPPAAPITLCVYCDGPGSLVPPPDMSGSEGR
ncbi:hypothetical protein [Frankia tisae]|uniref:hypothetical protein n=1 Tax=Frankia tisae TaxID=2950104 RepID=UPI0021BF566A|nr:hypothetical protein [Frankia tisae]